MARNVWGMVEGTYFGGLSFFSLHLIGPIVAEVFTDSTLRDELYQQVLRPAVDLLEAYLQAQVAAGKFRPCNPMLISRAIVGAAWFNSTLKLAQIDARYADLTPEAMIEALVDWLVAGLCE